MFVVSEMDWVALLISLQTLHCTLKYTAQSTMDTTHRMYTAQSTMKHHTLYTAQSTLKVALCVTLHSSETGLMLLPFLLTSVQC